MGGARSLHPFDPARVLCERWAALAPDLAGHVTAVGFDPDSGRLTLCPESMAWATKTHLEQTRVIEAANKAAGRMTSSLFEGDGPTRRS
ncbi:DciA family protein [Streptomyces sp. XY66]|uniref:DciA family protein n=1 Tax=Streptomyces sp. XY66 TaxID=1415563 RepID=UPI0006AFAE71|nr:DciA family protein [Streptomyces sp. XY66]